MWAWHPPVGTWIGVLGFLGVIVAIVRDPKEISQREKVVWIMALFLLLGLELKTLYQDRDEHDAAERESRERSEENFREIAKGIEKTTSDVGRAIDALDTTLKEGRDHFDQTMNGISRTNGAQLAMNRKQQEMIDSANGHLLPATDAAAPTLNSLGCPADITARVPASADYYVLEINDKLTYIVWKFPFVPVAVELRVHDPAKPWLFANTYDMITLTKSANGDVVLTIGIRDKDENILIQFDENGFEVGPQLLKRHPNKSTLIATDFKGVEVFKVTYESKHFVHIQSRIVVDGVLLFDPSLVLHNRLCMPNMSFMMTSK